MNTQISKKPQLLFHKVGPEVSICKMLIIKNIAATTFADDTAILVLSYGMTTQRKFQTTGKVINSINEKFNHTPNLIDKKKVTFDFTGMC